MNAPTLIVAALIGAACIAIVAGEIKKRRSGKGGCASGGSCGGSCGCCGAKAGCHTQPK